MDRRFPVSLFLSAVSLALAAGAHARVHEEAFDLPAQVTDSYGKRFSQPIRVTVWTDDANPKPSPVLVLIEFPPQGEDGHQTFARFPQTWHPPVAAFLERQGFPALRPDPVAPETAPAAGAPPLPAHVPTTRDEASHD